MQEIENVLIPCACGCGQTLWRYSLDRKHTEHRYVHGHNTVKTKVQATCDFCGKPIEIPGYMLKKLKHHFCSHECTGKYRAGQFPVTCPKCGKSFTVPQNRIDKNGTTIYCSKKCLQAAHVIETTCAQCNLPIRRGVSHTISKPGYRHAFCSRKCQHLYQSIHCRGANHPRWIPGKQRIDYGYTWPSARAAALKRDHKTCQICGSQRKGHIDVHHIKPVRTFQDPEDAHDLQNLVTLCDSCHAKIEPRGACTSPVFPRNSASVMSETWTQPSLFDA